MNEKKITLALIYGGRGYESEVSLRGARNIFSTLSDMFDCLPVLIDKQGRWLLHKKEVVATKMGERGGFFCPKTGEFHPVDCVFPLLHGNFGEDGVIQSALEVAAIPYIGCSGRVGAICRDKAIVKAIAKSLEIPTLPSILLKTGDTDAIDRAEEEIGYPMFVKPTDLGSSFGASEARDREQLLLALNSAYSYSNRVIVEKLLEPKRELECGYFSAKGNVLFTNVGEILCEGSLYDFDSKYNSGTKTTEKADVDKRINDKIKNYSRRLVDFLGIRDLSRIDFFLSGEEIYFNEINTMPGFTSGSLYAKMLNATGIDTKEMLRALVFEALERA